MSQHGVLVVDDEIHFRYFLKVLFEKAGYMVKTARNGIEALEVLRSWTPSVITLDIMMPEQSGLIFYGTICKDKTWKSIPVVMLSAVPIPVREHALATLRLSHESIPQPAAFLEKPCTPKALLNIVHALSSESNTA